MKWLSADPKRSTSNVMSKSHLVRSLSSQTRNLHPKVSKSIQRGTVVKSGVATHECLLSPKKCMTQLSWRVQAGRNQNQIRAEYMEWMQTVVRAVPSEQAGDPKTTIFALSVLCAKDSLDLAMFGSFLRYKCHDCTSVALPSHTVFRETDGAKCEHTLPLR
jgi:hypothetical protein